MTRLRRIWRWSVIVGGCALFGTGVRACWLEPASLTIVEERVSVRWAVRGPVRIAILTDLHVGSRFNGLPKLREVVDRTNAARPDLVCILGDLVIQGVIGGQFVAPEPIAAELGRLQAPAGVVAVLGNHDGWLDHDRVRFALEQNRIRVIEETAIRTETASGAFWVAGVSDLWTGRHDISSALAAATPDDAPVILLTHNPDIFPDVPERVALTLAGHTHGGQVSLPFVGRPVVPSKFGQRFAAGHIIERGRHMFVATGVGTSILPVRFRVPPAVTMLTVEPERPNW